MSAPQKEDGELSEREEGEVSETELITDAVDRAKQPESREQLERNHYSPPPVRKSKACNLHFCFLIDLAMEGRQKAF